VARRRRGAAGALRDLVGAFLPLSLRNIDRELGDRLAKIPTKVNEYGFDPYGLDVGMMRRTLVPSVLLYRYYFRAETFGIERVPPGRVLLIANHAGQLPFDAAMLGMAMLLEAEPPRIARGMAEYWVPQLPFVAVLAARTGQMVGTPENCKELLENDECVAVFPEGVRGINKPYSQAYRLQRFGLGFMRLALETDTPVVPVAIVGSEEQQPGLANLAGLGRLLGMPAFPITLGFPWLGPLGILPLPVKYRIHFGEPMRFSGSAGEDDEAIEEKVGRVRNAVSTLLEKGRRERSGVFR
jgi:1-acyl-sn-glycerol-3-phosphate acyltransferase